MARNIPVEEGSTDYSQNFDSFSMTQWERCSHKDHPAATFLIRERPAFYATDDGNIKMALLPQ